MKKTLSFLLALTMILTVTMTLFIEVFAAKDGGILFEANFNSTDANFAPKTQYGSTSPIISDDGKTVTFKFDSTSSGGSAWGDSVKNLKITDETRYTVNVKFKSESSSDNAGIAVATNDSAKGYNGWYSFYGKTTNCNFTMNHRQISASEFNWGNFPCKKDADGYISVRFEFYGYHVGVYTLNSDDVYVLSDGFVISRAEGEVPAIMCGMFTWTNSGKISEVSIKDFVVTQGCSKEFMNKFSSASSGSLSEKYASAKNGELVWSANFNGDTHYTPTALDIDKKRADTTKTVSDDGRMLTMKGHTYGTTNASVGGGYFYADDVGGLAVRENTKYTIEFKVRTDVDYGGAVFLKVAGIVGEEYMSFYGDLRAESENYTIARGTRTAAYTASGQYTNAYSKFPSDKITTDGYYDVKVEIDGYDVTVYYNTAEGYKILTEYTIAYYDATIACGVYNYQSRALVELKDFNVYKGLTLSEDHSNQPETPDVDNPSTGDASAFIILTMISVISLGGMLATKKSR